jgi:F0F1-type ATP synthase assembly protein I
VSGEGRDSGRSPAIAKGAAYQGAVEAVLALLLGAGLGYWADSRFGSAPIGLIVGLGFGFGAFVLRLLRLRDLIEPPGPQDGGAAD